MPLPRRVYFFAPAFLTECGLMGLWLAEPLWALSRLHATPLQLGLLGMGNSGGYALLAIVAGWVSDRTGRRGWMLLGTLSQILAALALPFCRSATSFIVLATVHSTLLAFFWAPFMCLLSETTPSQTLSRTLSRWNMSWCLGGFIGSLISGPLYDRLSPAAPFFAAAAILSCSLLIQLAGGPGTVLKQAEPVHLDRPRVNRLMHQAWLALVSNFFVVSLLIYLFPTLAQTPRYHLDATAITLLHGLRTGAMLATFAVMGFTTAWHFRQWPLNLCFGLMLAMMALLARAPATWFFVPAFTLIGLTTGIAYGLSAYYSMLAPAGKGAVVGTHEMFLSSGSTIGPLFGGGIIQSSGRPDAPFWAGLAPLAILWLLTRGLRRGRRPKK